MKKIRPQTLNIKTRQPGKARLEEIIKDYNDKVLMVDMVAKYRISSSRIYQIMKDYREGKYGK